MLIKCFRVLIMIDPAEKNESRLWLKLYSSCARALGRYFFLAVAAVACAAALEVVGLALFIPLIKSITSKISAGADLEVDQDVISGLLLSWGVPLEVGIILPIIVVIFLGKGTIMYLQAVLVERVMIDLEAGTRQKLLNRIINSPLDRVEEQAAGATINTISSEVIGYVGTFRKLVQLLVNIFFVAIYLGTALLLSPVIVLIAILMFLTAAFLFTRVNVRLGNLSHSVTNSHSKIKGELIQFVRGLQYFRATGSESIVERHFRFATDFLASQQMRLTKINLAVVSGIEPVAVLGISVFLLASIQSSDQGLEESILAVAVLYRAFTRLMGLQVDVQKIYSGLGSFFAVSESLDKDVEHKILDFSRDESVVVPDYSIVLSDVSVVKNGVEILKKICLESDAKAGLGISGETGSGKTTLLKVLMGITRISHGDVSVGSTAIQHIDWTELSRKIGYVPQQPPIFDGSVVDNLTLWGAVVDSHCPKTEDEIYQILELVRLSEAIQNIGGIHTCLGEGGVRLSGGQEQRLALARELLKKPIALFLDEPTSALDEETEEHLIQILLAIKQKTKLIMVSHNSNVLATCDQVVTLRNGSVLSMQ